MYNLNSDDLPDGFEVIEYDYKDDYIGVNYIMGDRCWFIIDNVNKNNDNKEIILNISETGDFDNQDEYINTYTLEEFINILKNIKEKTDDPLF
jgi:hypothetical protein